MRRSKRWDEGETTANPDLPASSYPRIIYDYYDAECVAAAWVRRFGYRDATVTPPGSDDGIDVLATGAIAQVKYWHEKYVGVAEVQRLAGCAKRGQGCFFFASGGYTDHALRWADHPDHRVALFHFYNDGNLKPLNFHAELVLWKVPYRGTNQSPKGIPWYIGVPFAIISYGIFISSLVLLAAYLVQSNSDAIGLAVLSTLLVCWFAVAVAVTSVYTVPVIAKFHEERDASYGRGAMPISAPVPVTTGWPPDLYAGGSLTWVHRTFLFSEELGYWRRAIGRWARALR